MTQSWPARDYLAVNISSPTPRAARRRTRGVDGLPMRFAARRITASAAVAPDPANDARSRIISTKAQRADCLEHDHFGPLRSHGRDRRVVRRSLKDPPSACATSAATGGAPPLVSRRIAAPRTPGSGSARERVVQLYSAMVYEGPASPVDRARARGANAARRLHPLRRPWKRVTGPMLHRTNRVSTPARRHAQAHPNRRPAAWRSV